MCEKKANREVCDDMEQSIAITSQIQRIARAMNNSPPLHGILLVSTILTDPTIKELWIKEVKEILCQSGSSLNWDHITEQVGMFCFSGLTAEPVVQLARQFHVYMTTVGRIRMELWQSTMRKPAFFFKRISSSTSLSSHCW
ncbi:aspartate aminotransferase, mitochondrial-like [Euphorbia lathyris]|uniref:aspartate aminotransferase, mitochondrial-like n=1 Tax=Euphorbia lathyris TaxID=212925 RepID=UPI0033141C19